MFLTSYSTRYILKEMDPYEQMIYKKDTSDDVSFFGKLYIL